MTMVCDPRGVIYTLTDARMVYSFIPAYRKRYALSQHDLARLVGRTHDTIHRVEKGVQEPDLDLIMALEVVFGFPPSHLFPVSFGAAEERVMVAAKGVHDTLDGRNDDRANAIRALIENIPKRNNKEEVAADAI